jgi:hypothetical protein
LAGMSETALSWERCSIKSNWGDPGEVGCKQKVEHSYS